MPCKRATSRDGRACSRAERRVLACGDPWGARVRLSEGACAPSPAEPRVLACDDPWGRACADPGDPRRVSVPRSATCSRAKIRGACKPTQSVELRRARSPREKLRTPRVPSPRACLSCGVPAPRLPGRATARSQHTRPPSAPPALAHHERRARVRAPRRPSSRTTPPELAHHPAEPAERCAPRARAPCARRSRGSPAFARALPFGMELPAGPEPAHGKHAQRPTGNGPSPPHGKRPEPAGMGRVWPLPPPLRRGDVGSCGAGCGATRGATGTVAHAPRAAVGRHGRWRWGSRGTSPSMTVAVASTLSSLRQASRAAPPRALRGDSG